MNIVYHLRHSGILQVITCSFNPARTLADHAVTFYIAHTSAKANSIRSDVFCLAQAICFYYNLAFCSGHKLKFTQVYPCLAPDLLVDQKLCPSAGMMYCVFCVIHIVFIMMVRNINAVFAGFGNFRGIFH